MNLSFFSSWWFYFSILYLLFAEYGICFIHRAPYTSSTTLRLPMKSIKFASNSQTFYAKTALYCQSSEDFKVNSQIARLNAVAAKLRAEAADLEAEQRKAMVYNLASAFREFDRTHDGQVSVQELKKGIANSLSRTISEEQTMKIIQSLDLDEEKSREENDFRSVEELRRRLDKIIQDEKDAAFMAKRSSVSAKLAAQKAEAIAELISNRHPSVVDRIVASLPYLLPLLDALPYGRPLLEKSGILYSPILTPILFLQSIYQNIPLTGIIAFCTLVGASSSSSSLPASRLVRFSLLQAILLDMVLIPPGIIGSVLSFFSKALDIELPAVGSISALSSGLFLLYSGIFLYGIVSVAMGVEADRIPLVSSWVKQRVPTTQEFLDMFDDEGNFKPQSPLQLPGKQTSTLFA